MTRLSGPVVAFLLLALSSGCIPRGSTKPMVKIGLVAPFEGLYRPLGYEVLPAVKLALSERNQAGGVQGHMVELVALNDDQDPETAAQRASEMALDPDVVGVIGHFGEQTTVASLPIYRAAGLALVVSATTATEVTEQGHGQTFRLVADDRVLGAAAARYAVVEQDARRVAVVGGPSEVVDSFVSMAQQMGAVVSQYPDDHQRSLLSFLASGSHDLIFFAGDGMQGAELVAELRKSGIDIPFMGANGLDNPHFVQVAGDAADGAVYMSVAPPVRDQDFVEGYWALSGGLPGPHAALAYDAATLLLDAIEMSVLEQGQPTREGVIKALSGVEAHDGLTGPISFDERGQALGRQVYVYEIVGGQYPGQLRECDACAP
ncbi:MAG: ABC transporter substrate-binding protein [Anaerolineae bacterium]|nr:ABC transporter substrate-binding protein [Anaerolineae bacterium]NIN98324.1 ABC transporter substrate-binding protein [Anaerolineae bacterium]NIQ81253.1 ABC transporter substrate-binding protein [Anaerolineae bacterium]